MEFFKAIGYSINPQFTNDDAACLIISEEIYVMLVTEKMFATFTQKEIADATKVTESITAIAVDSREEVDQIVNRALAAGGTPYSQTDDLGWMYTRKFADLDGHQWEFFFMDISLIPTA